MPRPENRTLLVANRGEIARRVVRTARDLGWTTVAVHTDLDAGALHAREADRAVRIGSYLDIDEVVAAARQAEAGFVHPGYGFLSERAEFARALERARITLLGPSADVMEAMGRKDHAREVAIAAGVPVIPSWPATDDPATFDYPVLVKAAAGGGGKGMRVVERAADFGEALAAATREASASFGDSTMLVEKYVASGRHIEVQVVGDNHGTVRHFFERDCSTQRRHQKVLEEAPAPTLTDAQRAEMTDAGVALAAQVGYTGAGTVEFLLDNATGAFHFLEMNTRLQVEHPVTEEAVRLDGERLDLVALQLQVALGEPLGFDQSAVQLVGCAIEARVYAEDAFGGFLPQAGRAEEVRWGTAGEDGVGGVRVDHALESGQVVSTAYDPMLGKVVGTGPDRETARARLEEALAGTEIWGLTTNTGFLAELVRTDEFREARIDTAWLDHHQVPRPDDTRAREVAAAALLGPVPRTGPWRHDGWRSAGPAAASRVRLDTWVEVDPRLRARAPRGRDPLPGMVEVDRGGGGRWRAVVHPGRVEVVERGQRFVFERFDPFADHAAGAADGNVVAPMPGTLLQVRVAVGEHVTAGQSLGILEAMKMELPLRAPFAGVVTSVPLHEGSQVTLGATLFAVEATGA